MFLQHLQVFVACVDGPDHLSGLCFIQRATVRSTFFSQDDTHLSCCQIVMVTQ